MNIIDLGPEPNESLDAMERYLLQQLARLQAEYQKAAAPYLQELSRINSLHPYRYAIAVQSVPPGALDGAIPAPIERVCDARADTGACHHQWLPGFGPNVCPKENNDDDKRASGTHAPAETVGDGAGDKKANTSLHGVGSQGRKPASNNHE